MNITFLVGNGFDISAGLKTSYKDFYEWYCNIENSSNNEESEAAIQKLKESIYVGEYWADLELGLGQFTEGFTLSEADIFLYCYQDVLKKILNFLKLEEEKYDKYLITDEAVETFRRSILNLEYAFKPKEKTLFQNIFNEKAKRGESITINFISFNYTQILDWFVKAAAEKGPIQQETNTKTHNKLEATINPSVLHLHGDTEHFSVLGVCEEKYIANTDLLQDVRIRDVLLKQNCIDYLQDYRYDDAKHLIGSSDIICIFGMSLGESDSKWWKEVLSWLNYNSQRHLIIFWFTTDSKDYISIPELHNSVDPILNKLTSYYNPSPDFTKKIQNRIHIVLDTEPMLIIPTCRKN